MRVVARVHEYQLLRSDLKGVTPADASREDSIVITENYINNWIRETVVLHQANLNLTTEEKDVEKQLENYRRSLIIYAYEKALIEQSLDTTVSIGAIEEYYLKNQKNFELKDYILKVLYVTADTITPGIEQVEEWYGLKKEEDLQLLKDYCNQSSVKFYYDNQEWLYLDDLLKEIPIPVLDKEHFLENNQHVRYEKDGTVYFLNILDYKLKDNVSPLSLQQANIRNILINQRKRKLIDEMRRDLYQDALNRKNIEIIAE